MKLRVVFSFLLLSLIILSSCGGKIQQQTWEPHHNKKPRTR